MLVEIPCPTCGGPSLDVDGELSCPLCGNQPTPPELESINQLAGQPADSVEPVEVPTHISFSAVGEDWTSDKISFALQFLFGFIESYQGFPQLESSPNEIALEYSPGPDEAESIAELCGRFQVSPSLLMSTALKVFSDTESQS